MEKRRSGEMSEQGADGPREEIKRNCPAITDRPAIYRISTRPESAENPKITGAGKSRERTGRRKEKKSYCSSRHLFYAEMQKNA